MTRVQALLDALQWSQPRLAKAVGVTQTTIWRLARGDRESGPMKMALDLVARDHGLPHLVFDVFPSAAAAISSSAAPDASAAFPDPPSGEAA
jgi:transcriptional regulator with XRE-family HTH domain